MPSTTRPIAKKVPATIRISRSAISVDAHSRSTRLVDPLDRLIATTRPWPIRFGQKLGMGLWRVWLTGALIWLFGLPLVWRQWNLISPVALVLNFLMWLPVTNHKRDEVLYLAVCP